MHNFNQKRALDALAATGRELINAGETEPVTVVLCGAVAGILTGQLSGDRQTLDCDVIASEPQESFEAIANAAAVAAEQLDLKPQWLNRDSRMYAHLLPVGWKDRLQRIDRFGPLEIMAISRRDLLALKLMGSKQRPQDLEDIEEMQPTEDEMNFLSDYLDQMEAESLDRQTFDLERSILNDLREPK